jgi:hypothetical protein
MENASKTVSHFGWRVNGGFLEGYRRPSGKVVSTPSTLERCTDRPQIFTPIHSLDKLNRITLGGGVTPIIRLASFSCPGANRRRFCQNRSMATRLCAGPHPPLWPYPSACRGTPSTRPRERHTRSTKPLGVRYQVVSPGRLLDNCTKVLSNSLERVPQTAHEFKPGRLQ